MKAFLITSAFESSRKEQVDKLIRDSPFPVEIVDGVYPTHQHVPFADQLIAASKQRTGKALLPGELGCLLSHRKVWRQIVNAAEQDHTHFLVFESDSHIEDSSLLSSSFALLTEHHDMFFWGAWEGHMKLFRSSIQSLSSGYRSGVPYIRTAYCTYGYSLNRKAAQLLLKRTSRISHPVDQFKYFFSQEELKLGGILPEVIAGNRLNSTIRGNEDGWKKRSLLFILDIKNSIICALR